MASACRHPREEAVGSPGRLLPQPTLPNDSLSSPAIDVYQPGILRYRYRLISVVGSPGSHDSLHHTDSTVTSATLTVSLTPRITGITTGVLAIDSAELRTLGLDSLLHSFPNKAIRFTNDAVGSVRVSPHDTESHRTCIDADTVSEAPISIDAIIPSIRPTEAWRDTETFDRCFGSMLMHFIVESTYSLTPPTTTATRFLVRLSRISLTGSGKQWSQPVMITGTGTSTDTLTITGSPPRIVQANALTELRIDFHSTFRSQEFTQSTNALAVLIP